MSTNNIPILDLAKVNITLAEEEIDVETCQSVGKDLVKALTGVGFFYIKNHGIPQGEINQLSEAGKTFFELPGDTKIARVRDLSKGVCGYIPIPGVYSDDMPNERFDHSKPADHKEALNICHKCEPSVWPEKEFPEFKTITMSIISQAQELSKRILLLIGYVLSPDSPKYFQDGFKNCGTMENMSQIKFIHYAATSQAEVAKGGMRCGEHTDLGLITLLFLDSTPGLQIFDRKGDYLDVDSSEDTILVNIGDLLQRWTSDVLHSAKHRVIYRPDTYNRDRYSIVYFSVPDNEAMISPVVEPVDKYPSIKAKDYFEKRIHDAFVGGKGIDSELNIPK